MSNIRKLADARWVFFVLLGLTLTFAACSSNDSSCNEGDSDYPECLGTAG